MVDNRETILYIVRHGQTEGNLRFAYHGHTDTPLNETGAVQAKQRGLELKDIKFDAIYSSDLSRTVQTAEYIKLERDLAIKTTALLRELNFGELEGKSRKEIEQQQEFVEIFKHLDTLTSKERMKFKIHPSMEGREEALSRYIRALREISVAHLGQTVLVTTHAGVTRHFLGHLDEKYYDLRIRNTGWVKISCNGVDFRILETKDIVSTEEYLKDFESK